MACSQPSRSEQVRTQTTRRCRGPSLYETSSISNPQGPWCHRPPTDITISYHIVCFCLDDFTEFSDEQLCEIIASELPRI
jgi:hypothetical protein